MSDTKTTPSIDVRMYNHGLGDCFLLTIRGKGKEKAHMLIDCGLHGLQANKRGLFEKVLQDIREHTRQADGTSVLDVVVATHRHFDHLSGFQIVGAGGKEFNDIQIKELWLAWTENEEDAEARNFQLAQKKKEQAMRMALGKIEKAGFDAAYTEQFRYLLGFVYDFEQLEAAGNGDGLGLAGDMLGADGMDSNEEALHFLQKKVGKDNVRYMEPPVEGIPGKEPGNKPIDIGIDGVRVYVLGPPKQNAEEFLGSMDPRQGEGFGEHEGEAHLFPEEAAFLHALGMDSNNTRGGLAGSDKDYPFSKNYKALHNPFTNHYLLSERLQLVLKNNMGHLLRKLLCLEVERLGRAPLGTALLEALQKEEPAKTRRAESINRGLDHLLLMKLKNALRKILNRKQEEGLVKGYYMKDYEPQILKTPYLDDAALDEMFEKQLQNYLAGLAPWAANFRPPEEEGSLSFRDILRLLLEDWVKTAIKKLIGEIFREFQVQRESFTDALKHYIFQNLEEAEKAAMEELFPTEEDKRDFTSLLVNERMSLSAIISSDEGELNQIIFQPGAEYVSSILVRERFREAISGKYVAAGRGFNPEGVVRLDTESDITNLILDTIIQGLDLKLEELRQELKDRTRGRAAHIREDHFLSHTDRSILAKYLGEGLPANLLDGLSALDRIVLEYESTPNQWRNIDKDWLRSAEIMALKLDSVRNNTSLVLAIELAGSGKVLLFPGDAQAGNWRSWGEVEYEVAGKKVRGTDLLERTAFYKVGHHGSHNATISKNGLDLMKKDSLAAMIPVDQHVADKVGWEMPFAPLLEALLEKTNGKVAIADAKMDISRMLEQLPEEHQTESLRKHLEELKKKWESAAKAFMPSKKELVFSYKVENKKGKKETVKVKRPLYFEYRVE
ncbi:MAG: hypothetical protein KDD10_25110 [Phaeodactylibacter sp.]|nr:hypothetical protein [Phaeodactylibacter sp.]MCB9298489.1 hypothetical protein [Lewinellaceae bacterium]